MKNRVKFSYTHEAAGTGHIYKATTHSLDTLVQAGNYNIQGHAVCDSDGLPSDFSNKKYHLGMTLNVTDSAVSGKNLKSSVVTQVLTVGAENGGEKYVRSISYDKNTVENQWSPWQMVVTGDVDAVAPGNDLNQKVSQLSKDLQDEISHTMLIEDSLVDGSFIVGEAYTAKKVRPGAITKEMLDGHLQLSATVIDNLDTANTLMPLSAHMGKLLAERVGEVKTLLHPFSPDNECATYIKEIYFRNISEYKGAELKIEIRRNTTETLMQLYADNIIISTFYATDWNGYGLVSLKQYNNSNVSGYAILDVKKLLGSKNFTLNHDAIDKLDNSPVIHTYTSDYVENSIYTDGNNNTLNGAINGNTLVLYGNGISISCKDGNLYYIGYVAGEDECETLELTALTGGTRTYLYVDTSVLIKDKRVSFSKALLHTNLLQNDERYKLLAVWYGEKLLATLFTAEFKLRNLEKTLPLLKTNLLSYEIGGLDDSTGEETVRTDRVRSAYISRNNLIGISLKGNEKIYAWALSYDKDFKFIGKTYNSWLTNQNSYNTDNLSDEVAYIRFTLKKADNTDITEADTNDITTVLKSLFSTDMILQSLETLSTRISEQQQQLKTEYTLKYNISENNVYIYGDTVYIDPNGFGIVLGNSTYWIANADRTMTEDYEFTLTQRQSFLVIDTRRLTQVDARNELSNVISIVSGVDLSYHIPLFYKYDNVDVVPIGKMRDFYFMQNKDRTTINNDILFAPDFYACKHGRRNNANGVGTGWYERFRITHISDTHQYNKLYKESLKVSATKMNVVVNTGDDSNYANSTQGELIKQELETSAAIIRKHNKLPYLQVPGNHDVPGITKEEYFSRICSVVGEMSDTVWGDAENFRAYGYCDLSGGYEGDFRIIMLDPFDYDDGLFENTYPHMSAVFSQKQADWLIETLLDAATKGLNVITMMHYSFGDAPSFGEDNAYPDAQYCQDAFMIPDIIDAIQKRTSLVAEYPDSKGINNITINRDFTSAGELHFVAHLFGHIHSKNHYRCQKSNGSKKYDILMLGEAALGTYGNALNKAYREADTVNEIAFSALEVDVIEQCIYRVSYGSYLNYDKSNSERTTKIPYRFND